MDGLDGGEVLAGLAILDEVEEEREGLDVGVREDDGGGDARLEVQQLRHERTEQSEETGGDTDWQPLLRHHAGGGGALDDGAHQVHSLLLS